MTGATTWSLDYARAPTWNTRCPVVRAGRCPMWRRPQARAAPHPVRRWTHGPGLWRTRNTAAKPVKSARVVGDVLGASTARRHRGLRRAGAHGAGLAQRYPLIDGQGNLAAATATALPPCGTPARLASITSLLLDEIDEGTVDFSPTTTAATEELRQLPARLPFALLNGASGIAVWPPRSPATTCANCRDACVALIKTPETAEDELLAIVPGPDTPVAARSSAPLATLPTPTAPAAAA